MFQLGNRQEVWAGKDPLFLEQAAPAATLSHERNSRDAPKVPAGAASGSASKANSRLPLTAEPKIKA